MKDSESVFVILKENEVLMGTDNPSINNSIYQCNGIASNGIIGSLLTNFININKNKFIHDNFDISIYKDHKYILPNNSLDKYLKSATERLSLKDKLDKYDEE